MRFCPAKTIQEAKNQIHRSADARRKTREKPQTPARGGWSLQAKCELFLTALLEADV